ncbi:T9SS type B sorting domain-containing protein [Tenacibaculum finnmarkense]|uniref:T9SS type B sorting domain-containing protein n=1 Tax=Tenacibaculum finnmarkense TaxID=2781243 RepID=UPI000C3DB0A4|nr:T9SS type B sorting domain-containing protein [Tenacibaculum finnmarkense]MBE7660271.1 T9SS type B sorting domain-containing protein [Tenacibaculum finnmarkense genomovar finnmarkense]MCG8251959.1 T9SS type B sorting domain-containing protein [Tenacibaculum finnmarkense genomovar finnmarkense]MCG8815488.1 T9SS type B sorting domain-containing protein [Tenacibaculum finnmarkense]MCG8820512.1 T9SS type B sorting domain-containing protein [Tenacibaculum finnmarkense]SOS51459.1 Putative adhesin
MIKKILLLASLFFTLISFSQKIDASLEHLREGESVMMERTIPLALGQRPSGFTQSDINKNSADKDLTLRGNMTFIGNSNLNRNLKKTREYWQNIDRDNVVVRRSAQGIQLYNLDDEPNTSYDPLDLLIYNLRTGGAYSLTGNGQFYMDYVDVDSDASTFSSSTATLNLPNCSRVAYAGLYWAGVYPSEFWENAVPRSNDYDKIKFKYPSSMAYKNITADEIIYNVNEPYICFKDITTDVQAEANPNGVYTAANIRAIRGFANGLGGASGWVMIVVYENDNESSKKFSVFDGFAAVSNGNSQEVKFTGFKTIPKGPVNVELIMATLEGDSNITGDDYQIKDAAGNYVNVFNTISPQDNFFNGSISVFDTYLAGRNPASTNTLGFDVDHIKIKNTGNSIIGNNEIEAEVKFTSVGDVYWPFLNAMSVEVVEPKIKLVKTITDASGGDISGTPVGLGSSLFYDLTFSSVGTDNAKNTVIIDELPKNVNLSLGDILPASIQLVATAPAYPNTNTDIVYTYEPPVSANGFRGKLRFYIPDSFVKIKGAEHSIKLKIEVVSDCSKLRDVCSDKIENQAYANYSRDLSALNVGDLGYTPGYNRIENTPSFSGIDACNLGQAGSSNFLIDTSGCTFERTEILCGKNILLAAGTGFTSYSWVNENAPLTVLGTSQTYNATQTGTYLVTKVAPTGCVTSTEKIIVIPYSTAPNPLIPFADQISTSCASNNEKLAEIILCGGSRTINLPFTGATGTTVKWFKLDETCAFKAAKKCANLDTSCTWNEIGTTFSKEFSTKGQYKVEVFYDGKCPSTYYFNVFTSSLSQTIVKKHIICGTDGSITVNDVSVDYEYQLTKPDGTTIPANGFQNGKAFTGLKDSGDYDVKIRLQGSPAGACHYTIPNINIQKQALGLTVAPEFNASCDGKAIITAQVNGTLPGNYIYTLLNSVGGVIETKAATSDKSVTFEVTTAGLYSVKVATATTTCTETVITRVIKPTPLILTAVATKNITCTAGSSDGIITLVGANGVPNTTGDKYSYALLSIDGIAVSPKTYFTDTTYNVVNGTEGDYIFEVTDSKNCTATATAKISVEAPLQFTHKETQVNCNKKGTITVDVTNNTGYKLEYSIDNATWKTTGFFDGLNATTAATLYTVYIRATKGTYQCNYQIQNIAITETGGLSAGSAVATGLECRWENTQSSPIGTITFTQPTGGTAPFTYFYKLASDTNFTTVTSGITASVPVAGTYNTKVEDKNGCSLALDTVTIDALPTEPVLSSEVLLCGTTGTIIITAAPNDPSYTYSIDGTNFQASNVFENVAQRWHRITVKYGKSCTRTLDVLVYGRPLTGSVTATTDSDCSGSDNGSITVNARNFQGGSYEYSTDGGITWEETGDNPYRIVGLAKGDYDLKIRETIGTAPNLVSCEVDLGKHTIGEPTKLELINTGITTPATCVTGATITVEASGGTPPYKFSIDGGTSWQNANSSNQYIYTGVAVRAKKYQVMLLDSKKCDECGCTDNPFENGSFEDLNFRKFYPEHIKEDDFPGWETTASDNKIEIWSEKKYENIPSYDGDNFVELNGNVEGSLYQEFCTKPGDKISWSVAHRGRSGVDVATVKIGGSLASANIEATMSDGKTWKEYSSSTPYIVPAGQTTTVISFDAVSTAGGDKTIGNFIDAVKIEINRKTCVLKDIKVTAAAAATHTATVTNSCTDPKIEITATGTAPYQFTIDNGATWQTSNNAMFVFNTTNGLALPTTTAVNYQVKTINGGGCESPVSTLTVYPKLEIKTAKTPKTCTKDATITITASGGDTNYVYEISPSAGTTITGNKITVTNTGIPYTVKVKDNNGTGDFCTVEEIVPITEIKSPIITNITATALDCTVNTKASISFEVSEGKAPFSYTVNGGTSKTILSNGNAATIPNLDAGTYKIIVTDTNNCVSAEISEKIEALASLTGGSAVATNLKCSTSGTVFGTITFTNPTTGTPDLSGNYTFYYKLTADTAYNVATGNSKTGLPAGTYNTKVVDSKGCSLSFPDLTIDDLPTVLTTTKPVTYNCDGKGNVKVTVTTTPIPTATAPITYTLGADTNETGEFTNLQVGNHTVSVNYGSDCILPVIVEVKDNQNFTAVASSVENPKCKDGTDGKIKVVASFGSVAVNSFEYSTDGTTWIPVASNEVIIDTFGAGNHIIEVRQNLGGCEVDSNAIKLTAPASEVIVDLSTKTLTKEITCNPNTGATITPSASGGNGAPYAFELFDSLNNPVAFTGLSAGTYSVVATDKLGCKSDSFEIEIKAPKTVTFTATASVCHTGNDAEIEVTGITGNDANFTFSVHDGTSIIRTGSITGAAHTISGLSAGTYKVTVTDGFGCSETEDVIINENLTISATTTQQTCNPGDLTITASGGKDTNYVYAVVTSGAGVPADTSFSVTAPTEITAGTWDIYVRDNGGTGTLGTDYCQAIFTTNKVTKIPELKVDTVTAIQPKCSTDKGTINVTVSGGKAAYTVTLTGLLGTTSVQPQTGNSLNYEFKDLVADTYTIKVTDVNTCASAEKTQEIKVPSALKDGEAVPTDLACGVSGGSITFTNPTGGTPGYIYSYKLIGAATYMPLAVGETVISNLSAGTYDTKVSDAEGCTIPLTQVTIKALPAVPTFDPTTITYNCDGTATIKVTPTVAAAMAYSYMLDKDKTTTNNTGEFTAVATGSHTVSVSYGSNCSTDIIVEVKANQEFTASITGQTNPVCKDDKNGKIEVTASFPSVTPTSFEYSTDGTTWITVNSNKVTIDGFNAGTPDITHTINVRPTGKTSPSACDVTLTKILTNPTEVKVTKAPHTKITCTSPTSTITPTASGGNGAVYTFELLNSAKASYSPVKTTTTTFTNVAAGTHYVVAKDKENCPSAPFEVTIAAKKDVEFTATASACHTGSDASITLDVTKGNGTYSFALTGTATKTGNITGTSHTIPNLSAGIYTVTVTDGFGCKLEVKDITINAKITATLSTTQETCKDGTLTIASVAGASGANYVYAVVTENTAPTTFTPITNPLLTTVSLSKGKYDVYIRDNNGTGTLGTDYCEYKETKEITKIPDLTATEKTIIQPNCFGETGSLVFEISGGKPTYTYTINGAIPAAATVTVVGNTHTIAGLVADDYDIIVKDANTCTVTIPTQTIKAPDKLENGSAIPIHFTCKTLKGGIDFVNPNGGTGVYTFSYKLDTAPVTDFQPVVGNQHLGLDAGTYNIKVKDVNNCEISLNDVTINPLPTAPTLTESVAYNCDGKGRITVLPFDASYTYSLDGATPQTGANPNVFADLDAGSYTVSVGYGSDCFTDIDVIVANDKKFGASVIKTVNPTCFGASDGSITIEAVNATLQYEYSINGGTWKSAATNIVTESGLADGTYDVKVRQNNTALLCEVIVSTEKLDNPDKVGVTATVIKEITCNPNIGATIQVTPKNGIAPYTFELLDSSGNPLPIPITTTTNFTNISKGKYKIVATDKNGAGCKSDAVTIEVKAKIDVSFDVKALCYDGSNGTINVTNILGNGKFKYTQNGGTTLNAIPAGATSFTITGLSPGVHKIKIIDERGCSLEKTITIYPELSATATPTNLSCTPAGAPTGQILVVPSGGTGFVTPTDYQFSVVTANTTAPAAGTYSATNPITGLAAGTYDVYVKDAQNCEYIVEDILIKTITPIEITLTPNNPTCTTNGNVSGIITANTGQIEHTITLKDNAGVLIETIANHSLSTFNFNDIPAGTGYEVEITDSLGCTDTKTFDLVTPPVLAATLASILPDCDVPFVGNETLFGFKFENITAVASPYAIEYSKDNGITWETSPVFTSINQGIVVYPIIRLLENGVVKCTEKFNSYEIPFDVNGLIVDPIASPGNCALGFSVTVQAINGVGPFEFAIDDITSPTAWQSADILINTDKNGVVIDADRTLTYNGLTPGLSYVFYVRDSRGCIEKNSEDLYVDFNPTVPITGLVNNQTCATNDNGSITFSIVNNFGDLSNDFTWTLFKRDETTNLGVKVSSYIDKPQTGFTDIIVNGLGKGKYYLEIENNIKTCTFGSQDVKIEPIAPINGTFKKINDITCSVDGEVLIENVVGGLPATTGAAYTYKVINLVNATTATVTGSSITVAHTDVTDPALPVTFDIEIVDANPAPNSCTKTIGNLSLTVSQSPTISPVTVNSCGAVNTIDINTTSGLAPYQYSIDGGVTFTAPISTANHTMNVSDGLNQILTVKDANGCTATETFNVHPDITFDIDNITVPSCDTSNNSANNATATITVNTGSGAGNYQYILDSGTAVVFAGTSVILPANLNTGNHTIEIFDTANNCSLKKTFTVSNTITPSFTAIITKNNICDAATNGEITITPTINGAEPLTFTVLNTTTNVTLPTKTVSTADPVIFDNLSAGEYKITAKGANGCTTPPNTIKIEEFDPIIVPAPTVTEFACTTGNTRNSAIVKVDKTAITKGSGTYIKAEFVFTPNGGGAVVTPPASSNFEFTTDNVLGGTVDITVYDDQGCEGTTSATIAAFDALPTTATPTASQLISCGTNEEITVTFDAPLATTATITVTQTTGSGYAAVTQTGTGVSTATFKGLPVGKYKITLANVTTGCELTTYHTVTAIPAYTILLSDKIDTSCFGTDSGSIKIDVDGYVGNYDYEIVTKAGASLSPAKTGTGTGTIPVRTPKEITGLKAGDYTVNITTGTINCTVTPIDFKIEDAPAVLSVEAEETSAVQCIDDANATITVTETKGGWGRYEYQLEDASGIVLGYDFTTNTTNKIFTGLSHGTYKVSVRDALGCIVPSNDIIITNPTQVEFTVTKDDTVCDANIAGSITVDLKDAVSGLAGGKPPYTYTLTNTTSGVVKTKTITDTEYTFTGLSKANYTVSVKDGNQCIGTGTADIEIFDDIVFNEPTLVTGLKCQTGTGVSPNTNTNAVYNINVSGGSGNFTYLVTEKDDTSKVIIVTPATLTTPPTFKTSVAEEYTITITDIGGNCPITRDFTVAESVKPYFEAEATTTDICFESSDGVISITSELQNGINDLDYTINATPVINFDKATKTFKGLKAGKYIVTGTGTNDCTFVHAEIEIKQTPKVTIATDAIKDIEYSCSPEIPMATIKVDKNELSGGSGNYNVAFVYDNGTPADTTDDVTQAVPNVFKFTTTNTSGGKVKIIVSDDQGCSSTEEEVTIPAFAPIGDLKVTQKTPITCSVNESIKVIFTGTINKITVTQTGVLTGGYVQNPASPVLTSPIEFTDLPTGNYTISVTDAVTGCEATRFHTVSKIPVYDVVLSDKKDIACFNGKGSIEIDVKDYTGNYNYEVVDSVTGIGLTSAITGTNISAGTSEEITGLEAGKYKIKITLINSNDKNCSVNLSSEFEIIKPAIILGVTADVTTKISCTDDANATITATATGGWNSSYEYQLEDTSGTAITVKDKTGTDVIYNFANNKGNNIFENLPEGTYKVRVKDALGCDVESAEVIVENPTKVEFTVSKDDTICDNKIGGEITVTGSGGTGTYTYTLTDDSNPVKVTKETGATGAYTFTNLPAANYTVTVKDTNQCNGTVKISGNDTLEIFENIDFPTPTSTDLLTCVSTDEVTFNIVASGGSGTFTYGIVKNEASGDIEELATTTFTSPTIFKTSKAGTYTVTITDTGAIGNCLNPITRTFTVNEPAQPDFNPKATTNNICFDSSDGVIAVNEVFVAEVNPVTYTISLNGGTFENGTFDAVTKTFSALKLGTYIIKGTGDNGCSVTSKDVTIEQLDKVILNLLAVDIQNAITYNCDVANPTATITVDKTDIKGGTGNYNVEFVYDNGTPTDNTDDVTQIDSSTFTFTTTNVLGGIVEIKVTDDQGCDSDIKTVTIPAFAAILPSDIQISHTPTCEVGKQSITVKLDNLDPTIITPIKVEIEKPDGTIISKEIPRALANITGTVFNNLPVGIYTISIEDPVTGCVTTAQSYSVEAPVYNVLSSSIENTTCTGSETGSVVIDVQKGNSQEFYTGEYEYEVLDSVGNSLTPSPIKENVQAATGTTNPLKISGLKAGSYYVKITEIDNATACSFTSEVFTIEDAPIKLEVTADISSEITCTNDNNATITATATGGWGSNYEYQLEDNLGNTITVKDALGADVIYDFANNKGNNIFKNLPEGTYKVQVKDVLGCDNVYSKEQIIVNPKPVTFKTEMIANICSDTKPAIKVTAQGGSGEYIYTLKDSAGIEESITTTSLTHTFDNLSVDNNEDYTVSVNDVKGCIGTPETVNADVVTVYPDIALGLTPGKLTCIPGSENAEYIINVTGGSGDFSYSVVDKNDATNIVAVIKTTNPPTFSIADAGTYILKITDNKAEITCNSIESEDIVVDDKLVPAFEPQILVNNICNGSSTGEVLVKETPNGINPLEYSINTNPIITLPIGEFKFTGLSAGTYTITGKGTNDCTATKDVTIVEKTKITLDIVEIQNSVVEFSCTTGNQTNMATVTVTDAINGGTVPGGVQNINRIVFVYDNGTPLDATDDIEQDENDLIFNIVNNNNDIKAGTVTITVYDAQNCSSATTTVAIDAFQKIAEAEIKITQKLDCTNKEIITVKANHDIANPNIANLIYTIKGTNTTYDEQETIVSATGSATFTGLDTDVYTITITNPAIGCVFRTSHTVKDEPTFNIKIGGNKRTCFDATGIATATVTLDIETIIAAADYTGAYTYEVVDAITESSLTAPITGNGTGGVQNMISGLTAGTYKVKITMTDAPGCEPLSKDFTIESQPELTLDDSIVTFISCNSGEGAIILKADGGWGNYEYQLEKTKNNITTIEQPFSKNNKFEKLEEGSYTATVRDINNCEATFDFVLVKGVKLIVDTPKVTQNVCEGEKNASIEVNVTGGGQTQDTSIRTYSYILKYPNGIVLEQTSNIFTGLQAGNYQVRVIDNKYGCTTGALENVKVEIKDPNKVIISSVNITEDITCENNSTASVEVTAGGGKAPYEFSTDGINYTASASTTYTFTGLNPGLNTFYVKDTEQCVTTTTATIAEYVDLEATLNVDLGFITCKDDSNGVLSATVTGGFGNYEYQLLAGNGVAITGVWQISNTFSGLTPATYKIKVRSTNRFGEVCEMETIKDHEIKEPEALIPDVKVTQHVTCNGGNTGVITASATGGTKHYEYNIVSDPGSLEYPANKFVQDGEFTNLKAGTYYVTVKDVRGCTQAAIEVTVKQPNNIDITAVAITQQVCIYDATPTITVNVTGGTQPYYISINNDELLVPYSLNQITLGKDEGIEAGKKYSISVRGKDKGCSVATLDIQETTAAISLDVEAFSNYTCDSGNFIKAFVADKYKDDVIFTLDNGINTPLTNTTGEFIDVAPGDAYKVTATHNASSCTETSTDEFDIQDIQALAMTIDDSEKNKLIANVNFGLPPYNFTLDGVDYGQDNEFTILQTKEYEIKVTDARGCEVILLVTGRYVSISVLNLFTPDGDGINDFWYPLEVENYHNIKVYIYDRYARKIQNYQGLTQGWDGTYQGKPLPAGDYWYTIYYNELSGEEKKLMGHFTLYR